MKIIIDHREKCKAITKFIATQPNTNVTHQNLPVGDYLIQEAILLERKTMSDFIRSIIDGRLFDQAVRLLATQYRVAFILEKDDTASKKTKISREAMQGAIIMLSVTLGIPLIRTLSSQESAKVILFSANQLQHRTTHRPTRHGYHPKTKPKRQLYLLQGLPGIGIERAKLLLAHFGSVEKVMCANKEALCKVPSIGKETAKKIRWALK